MASPAKSRKPKAGRREAEEITDFVEAALVRRVSESQIIRLAAKQYSLGKRQTFRYIAVVRARWARESDGTAREERRTHMRRSLEDAYSRAMTPTKTKPDPDVSSATRVAKLMMDLDALAAPTRVDLGGTIGVAAAVVSTSTRAGLESFLRGDRAPKA